MTRVNDELANNKKGALSGSGQWSEYRQSPANGPVSWRGVDHAAITACLDGVTSNGDAILFGGSRDGSILVVTICSGNERAKFYYRSAEEAGAGLFDIASIAEKRSGRK